MAPPRPSPPCGEARWGRQMAPPRPSPPCGEARWGRQMAPTNHQNAVRTSTGTLDAPARRQSRQPPRLGPVDFLQYEAHHSPAERLEPSVAANVIRLFVHFTVDLNDQVRSTTCEVHDVRADRVLSPELTPSWRARNRHHIRVSTPVMFARRCWARWITGFSMTDQASDPRLPLGSQGVKAITAPPPSLPTRWGGTWA